MNQKITRRLFAKLLGTSSAALFPVTHTAADSIVIPSALPPVKELPFRQVHLDFHTSPLIEDVARDFRVDEFIQVLKKAHVNSITIFAKCHHGMSYHPTKVGVMHPHLKFDLMGQMLDALHKNGIRAPIYATVMWDELMAEKHPEWLVRDDKGEIILSTPQPPGYKTICLNTPYTDYLAQQTEEIVRNYRADGMFFDIFRYTDVGCSCEFCRTDRKKLGLSESQPDRWKFGQMVIERCLKRFYDIVKTAQPNSDVFFNGRVKVGLRAELQWFDQIEIESLPGGEWGYQHFQNNVRHVRTLGREYMGMTARFHRSWGDFGSLRNQAALDYEVFLMIAHGAKCSIGDQLHPRGTPAPAVYERIGNTYRSVAEKEPWLAGAKALTEIGVLSTNTVVFRNRYISEADRGITRMLVESHHQFDILDQEADFAKYKVLVLPDLCSLDEKLTRKIKAYLDQGGKLMLSYQSGLNAALNGFALPEIGAEFVRESVYKNEFLEPLPAVTQNLAGMHHVMYERGLSVRAAPGSEVLAWLWQPYFDRTQEHFSSHKQTPDNQRSEFAGVIQRGNVIYFSHPIFRMYHLHAYSFYRRLFVNCLNRLLPEPLLRTSAPTSAHAVMTEQPGRRNIHLLHYVPERRTPDIDICEDVIALHDVSLEIKSPKPAQVYLAPQKQKLPFTYLNGYVKLTVPIINGHQIIAIEA